MDYIIFTYIVGIIVYGAFYGDNLEALLWPYSVVLSAYNYLKSKSDE